MKSLRLNLVLSLALISIYALASIPAFAQSNFLEIKCVDASGNAVSGVKVTVDPMETHKVKEKKSDGKGIADFNKLDDGVYRAWGRKEGMAPAFYEFVVLKGGAKQTISLSFQSGDITKKLPFEDPALIQQSYASIEQGNNLLRGGKLPDAEKSYETAIEQNPANPEPYMNISLCYIQEGKFEQAEKSLKKASELATALKLLPGQAQTAYSQIFDRSQDLLTKLPMIRYRQEADRLLSAKRFDEAAAKYREALKLDPSDPDLHYNLGLALANGKKFDEANQEVDQAIAIAQKSIQATEANLKTLPDGPQKTQETTRLGDLNKSLAVYTELKKRAEEFRQNEILRQAQGILGEGDKLFNSKDYAGALKKYQEALPMVPGAKQSIVYEQVAKTYAQLKDGAQAEANFKKAIELSPDNDQYKKALAQYYLNEKRYEEALNLYAEEGGKGQADQTLFALGQKLYNQGKSQVAALALEKAIKLNPQNAESYYELGMIYYQEKMNDAKAKELLDKYAQIGKDPGHLDNIKGVLVVLKRRMSK